MQIWGSAILHVSQKAETGQAAVMRAVLKEINEVAATTTFIQVFRSSCAIAVNVELPADTAHHGAGKKGIFHIEPVFPCCAAQYYILALCGQEIAYGAQVKKRARNDRISILHHMQQACTIGGS